MTTRIARLIVAGLCALGAAGSGLAAEGPGQTTSFSISAQDLDRALMQFSEQSGIQLVMTAEAVRGKQTQGLQGAFEPGEALAKLLEGSGLRFRRVNEKSFAIRAEKPTVSAGPASEQGTQVRLAQAEARSDDGAQASAGNAADSRLEEIVVTAQKKEERLRDVPVPVSALDARGLVDSNQLRLQDYASNVPGLDVAPSRPSYQVLTIRGLTTGAANPTVGITVDDVPYGASTAQGGSNIIPDIDPSDLARVEVLRGPQGTLYGASSLGGLIKFVTVDPSTDGFSARVQTGVSGVRNGDGPGYNVRGSVNVPVSDTLAVRASAFTREDPGYIDNPVAGIDGVNEQRVKGGRLSALWRPSEVLSVKLSALFQRYEGDGSNDVDVGTGLKGLEQDHIPGSEEYDRKFQAYSATVNAKLGSVDLTSLTGYNINEFHDSLDYTYGFGFYTENGLGSFPGFGVPGTAITSDNKTKKFSQELRLSAPLGENVQWLVGAFYTDEKSPFLQEIPVLLDTGEKLDTWGTIDFPTTFKEYAAFADVTVDVTDRFDVQFGGRQSHIKQTSSETVVGPYGTVFLGASPFIYPEQNSSANAFTYLVTPRFRLTPQVMLYARLASGYRAGGPNVAPGVPREYEPDKTRNYEIGFKGELLGGALFVDTSVYYIDWNDIQISVTDPTNFQTYTTNASGAESKGIELALESRPVAGLTLSGWAAWNDAELSQDFPSGSTVFGDSGDRLPSTSRFSGRVAAQQDFTLRNGLVASVGASLNYVGDRRGSFKSIYSTPDRQELPSYARTDLRLGLESEAWSANLFVNNVTDRRGLLNGGVGEPIPYTFRYIQPRTYGVSLAWNF